MTYTFDITGLTPAQIQQISIMIDTFKQINQQQFSLADQNSSEFDPTPLFFESEILQPFNRTLIYGNRV